METPGLKKWIETKLVSRKGRVLQTGIPQLGLPQGARLEPSPDLQDVFGLEAKRVPLRIHFWVGPEGGRVKHASPLFWIPGVTVQSYCVDLLHCLVLGPLAKYIALTLRMFIKSGIFSPQQAHLLDSEDVQRIALQHIKSLLRIHYRRKRRESQEWQKQRSEIWDLTLKMLGPEDNPGLKAKGSL